MLLYIFQWLSEDIRFFSVFNYLSLRAVLAALTAMAIGFAAGPAVIGHENRPSRARVRSQKPSGQRRHADDGRRPDFGFNRHFHLALDGSVQSLRVGGAVRDARLWCNRLDR